MQWSRPRSLKIHYIQPPCWSNWEICCMCASEYMSHKSCCSSQLMVQMIFDRLCANVTSIWSITPTRGGRSYIWTCLPYRGRAFGNLALPLGRRCKHLPTQGWGSGSWIRDFSEQSLSLSSQKKRRWVQQPNKEGNWWCTTCLTTGRASLLSSRLKHNLMIFTLADWTSPAGIHLAWVTQLIYRASHMLQVWLLTQASHTNPTY